MKTNSMADAIPVGLRKQLAIDLIREIETVDDLTEIIVETNSKQKKLEGIWINQSINDKIVKDIEDLAKMF